MYHHVPIPPIVVGVLATHFEVSIACTPLTRVLPLNSRGVTRMPGGELNYNCHEIKEYGVMQSAYCSGGCSEWGKNTGVAYWEV